MKFRWIIQVSSFLASIFVIVKGNEDLSGAPKFTKEEEKVWPKKEATTTTFSPEGKKFGLNFMVIFIENINYLQDILDAEINDSIVQLPNLKKFKQESFLFRNAHSELHSTSSAATLLTGLPAIDTGMIKGKILPFNHIPSVASTGGLQHQHATLAESIKHVTKGPEMVKYLTAFIGYWKLGHGMGGKYLPHKRGFDFWTGVSFAHSNSCIGKKKYFKSTWRKGRYQYLDSICYILPWFIGILICIYSAYHFKVLTSKQLLNSLLYFILATFVFFLLLEIYRVQKSAACLLYHMNEITEQPYNMENLTLFFTNNALAMLDFFSSQSSPFFVSMNYLKLKEPHFSSNYFKGNRSRPKIINSLLELDWSIGKIMAKLEEQQLNENTMIFLTGNKNCKINKKMYSAFARKELKTFLPISVSDSIESCLQVPLYLKQAKLKPEQQESNVSISFLDIAPTILELITNVTQEDYPGCNILPAMSVKLNDSALPRIYELKQSGIIDESLQNKHRCNYENRLYVHFADIRKSIGVTAGGRFNLILSQLDEAGNVNTLDYPVIRDLHGNLDINNNQSLTYMEELYRNVSDLIEKRQSNRKNKWSSQFEMPVYPWVLPCANFPRCEASSYTLRDFSFMEPIGPGLVNVTNRQNDELYP